MSDLKVAEEELKLLQNSIKELEKQKRQLSKRINDMTYDTQVLQAKINAMKTSESSTFDWTAIKYEWTSKVEAILKNVFNLEEFRHQQLAAINATLSGTNLILLMPTGGGKSLCYQLPALVTDGITLVVSPLLSLITDQILALKKLNIEAVTLNSSNSKSKSQVVYDALCEGKGNIKLLYVTPEWLSKSKKLMACLQKCYERKALDRIAIDEVHCCSMWGHDFRPDYKYLRMFQYVFPKVPIIGVTATATDKVVYETQTLLNIEGCLLLKATFNRPNLYYKVDKKPSSQVKCLDFLESLLRGKYKGQSGIIYTTTINESVDMAKDLSKRGLSVACYHANMESEMRDNIHTKWLSMEYQAVVATVAFGMGIDKPDVRFVIHHCIPKSMENYYQESGRAGRDGKNADCLLLYSLKDMFRISSMVNTSLSGTTNLYKMVDYCIDPIRCRRLMIATHFDEVYKFTYCNKMCDHCQTPRQQIKVELSIYCQNIYDIIKFAKDKDTQMTAVKIIDAWLRTGGSKNLRPPNIPKPSINRELAERILSYLLVNGYLQEDIHFTPYSTISYISKGGTLLPENGVIHMFVCGSRTLNNLHKQISKNSKSDDRKKSASRSEVSQSDRRSTKRLLESSNKKSNKKPK